MIRPISSALLRHKSSVIIIVAEIAICCAVLCNALFLVYERIERLSADSGIDERSLVRIEIGMPRGQDNADAQTKADIASLRGVPGVEAVTVVNQIPYVNSSWNSPIKLRPEQESASLSAVVYMADEAFLDVLAPKLAEGRPFQASEFVDWAVIGEAGASAGFPAAIITSTMADRLFPGESAIGKRIFLLGEKPASIVGVVESLRVPDDTGDGNGQNSVVVPARIPVDMGSYVLRVDPTRAESILDAAVTAIENDGGGRVLLDASTLPALRERYYAEDRSMASTLVLACTLVLIVTVLGIVGISSFWVEMRTRQIGVRRALGATRADVLAYFRVENFIVVSAGSIIGLLLAYGLNSALMQLYEMQRLPVIFLPLGVSILWILGQCSIIGPARRAAAIPPSIATRQL